MIRIVVTAVIALVVGLVAGALVTFVFMQPTHGQLVCSVEDGGKVTNCTDSNGKQIHVPHDVRIRNP